MNTETGPRTEEDKILQTPVMVTLGGEKYEIKPLPVKYAMPWVKKIVSMMADATRYSKVDSDSPDFGAAYVVIMSDDPAVIIDLFWEYARDLNRAELEEKASSSEVVKGFEEVFALEIPLLQAVTRLGKVAAV